MSLAVGAETKKFEGVVVNLEFLIAAPVSNFLADWTNIEGIGLTAVDAIEMVVMVFGGIDFAIKRFAFGGDALLDLAFYLEEFEGAVDRGEANFEARLLHLKMEILGAGFGVLGLDELKDFLLVFGEFFRH